MKGLDDRFSRSDRPPVFNHVVRLLPINGSGKLSGVILNSHFWGFNTHWDNGRTRPCFSDHKLCDGCLRKLQQRWKGYLHLFNGRDPKGFYIEATRTAHDMFFDQVPAGTDLRGLKVCVYRQRDTKRAVLIIEPLDRFDGIDRLPEAVDPLPTLKRLWQID